jgi:hypothetical protein
MHDMLLADSQSRLRRSFFRKLHSAAVANNMGEHHVSGRRG